MSKYGVLGYIQFLKDSYNFIGYYDRMYNKNIDSIPYKNKFRYHLFCFSQITFALRDRLIADNSSDKRKINKFFEKGLDPVTEVGIVAKLANEWKHGGGFSLRQHYSMLREIRPSVYTATKVEQKLPRSHQYNNKDINLITIYGKCFDDINSFCIKNKYI